MTQRAADSIREKCGLAGGTPAPQESLPPDAEILELTAQTIAYDTLELSAPAGAAFGIHFVQNDAGVGGHDVDIRSNGEVIVNNEVLLEPGETTYTIEALDAGTYEFFCSIHPIPQMTGTLTVE